MSDYFHTIWQYPSGTASGKKRRPTGKYGVLCRKNWALERLTVSPHKHSYIEFEILLEGNGVHTLNGNSIPISRGGCIAVNQYDLHTYSFENPFTFLNISIDIKKMPAHILSLLNDVDFPIAGALSEEQIEKLTGWHSSIKNLLQEEDIYTKQRVYAYLTLFLTEIISNSSHVSKNVKKSGLNYVVAAIDYIEKHFEEDVYIEQIAEHTHISTNYLCKIFSKNMGMNITEYLTRIRIAKAQKLILETSNSITDISLMCGFGSQSAFSRAFNKYCGCSALEFKRKYKIK